MHNITPLLPFGSQKRFTILTERGVRWIWNILRIHIVHEEDVAVFEPDLGQVRFSARHYALRKVSSDLEFFRRLWVTEHEVV